jgi:D-arabinan endo alpha-(1,5)-arabinofuranosidase
MAPRRIASLSVASATALSVVFGIAPPAFAAPCTGAAAAVQPPRASNTGETPDLPGDGRPRGQRPTGTNDGAALPSLGQIPGLSQLGQVEQQAAVVPDPAQPVPDANPIAPPAPAAPSPPGTSLVGWVTGPESPNDTVNRFAITGTDLGIMWDNGSGEVLMAFGDTYGYCGVKGQQWRYNTLFRSRDGQLSKTVSASSSPLWSQGLSKQVINSIKFSPQEKGIIPTAGISVGGTQYVNFMSIKSWDSDGRWTTNFSAVAVSPDNGERWGVYPDSVRPARPGETDRAQYVAGNEKFQQGAFLKPGPGDPYIYSFGTPSGRGGAAYISRVLPAGVPDLRRYEYWSSDSNTWVPGDPAAATVVIPGPVSEMSAQFNTYLNQYLVLYGNGANDMVMRTAPAPQGPWSPERLIVPSMQFPGGIYAPFLHPWSTGKELYYNVSLWSAYNVMLMKTVLP